jgi:LuxR family maltose regulon positive regulatory protein
LAWVVPASSRCTGAPEHAAPPIVNGGGHAQAGARVAVPIERPRPPIRSFVRPDLKEPMAPARLIVSADHRAPAATAARRAPLAAKLRPPQAASFELPRTELCEKIFNAGAAHLVLLRAPAGFGKTTVMLQVRRRFEETGVPHAWLTLDRADNDVGRFLSVLIAALAPLVPGLRQFEQAQGLGPDELAFALIDTVAASPLPFALFLDDFEVLRGAAVLGLVQELLAQLPRGAQLIVGSRGVPDFGLGRLRARGRLLDVDPMQLRFSAEEVEGFLRERRGLSLSLDDMRRLHRSTEGWIAALCLASVTLENRADASRVIAGFSGSNAAVMEYLLEDVLSRQSEPVRDFLLHSSVLTELNASVCDAVCGRHDSAQLLRELEQAHLFLTPVGTEHADFRYHAMFGEFLRAQLQQQQPQAVAGLHRAAARWYVQHGRPVPAMEHALAGDDLALALPLLQAHGQSLLEQGRVNLLARLLGPMHEAGQLSGTPQLETLHVWAVCFARGPRAAAPFLEALERQDLQAPELRAQLFTLKALLLALVDRTDEALAHMQPATDLPVPDDGFVRSFFDVTLANLTMIAGRYHEALRLADAARSRQPEHASSFNFALSEAVEGAVDLTQGRLRRAIARLRLAVRTGATDSTRATNGNALVGVLLAEALYEADHGEQAERLLAVYIPLILRVGIPDQLISAHVVMARICQDRGDEERAQQLLAELEHIGHRDGLPRVVASARLERVRALVQQGQLQRARSELDRCHDRSIWRRVSQLSLRANEVETYEVALARWSIASGHAAQVVETLRAQLDAAERAQRERRALSLRLLLAQALRRTEQRNKAMRVLAKAVRQAASEGYVRAFLDEDPYLFHLLGELRAVPTLLLEGPRAAGVALEAPLQFVDQLLKRSPVAAPAPAARARATPVPEPMPAMGQEVLTRKEVQVIRLAAEGLSNEQIAERLFVAETTVRTHLRNINVKMDARNRMEAIALARRAGLIA